MSRDYLPDILQALNQPAVNQSNVFKEVPEQTHPVQVRESTYNRLKQIALQSNIKLVDLVDVMLKYSLSSGQFDKDKLLH